MMTVTHAVATNGHTLSALRFEARHKTPGGKLGIEVSDARDLLKTLKAEDRKSEYCLLVVLEKGIATVLVDEAEDEGPVMTVRYEDPSADNRFPAWKMVLPKNELGLCGHVSLNADYIMEACKTAKAIQKITEPKGKPVISFVLGEDDGPAKLSLASCPGWTFVLMPVRMAGDEAKAATASSKAIKAKAEKAPAKKVKVA